MDRLHSKSLPLWKVRNSTEVVSQRLEGGARGAENTNRRLLAVYLFDPDFKQPALCCAELLGKECRASHRPAQGCPTAFHHWAGTTYV